LQASVSLLIMVGKQRLQHYGKWRCNSREKQLATLWKKFLQKTPY
jgi:hypothetical protein